VLPPGRLIGAIMADPAARVDEPIVRTAISFDKRGAGIA
jgi:hypothetical protein